MTDSLLMLLPTENKALFSSANTANPLQGVGETFLHLPFALPPSLLIRQNEISSFLGKYTATDKIDADITFTDDLLFVQFTNGKRLRLLRQTPSEFKIIGNLGVVNFNVNGEKKVTDLTLHIQGRTLTCPKVLSTL